MDRFSGLKFERKQPMGIRDLPFEEEFEPPPLQAGLLWRLLPSIGFLIFVLAIVAIIILS